MVGRPWPLVCASLRVDVLAHGDGVGAGASVFGNDVPASCAAKSAPDGFGALGGVMVPSLHGVIEA